MSFDKPFNVKDQEHSEVVFIIVNQVIEKHFDLIIKQLDKTIDWKRIFRYFPSTKLLSDLNIRRKERMYQKKKYLEKFRKAYEGNPESYSQFEFD